MISQKAESLAGWMVKNETIEKSEMELYQYALESLFLSVMTIVLALLVGLVLGNVAQSIVLILPFMFLRKFSGGYHAKKMWVCVLGSTLLMLLCLYLAMNIQCSQSLAALTLLSAICLGIFSPVENSNRALQVQERKQYKKMTIFFLMIFLLTAAFTYYFGLTKFTKSICLGIQLSAGLQIPCIFKICLSRKWAALGK